METGSIKPVKKIGEISEYVVNQVKNAYSSNDPFPHLYVDNLFPSDFMQSIVKYYPVKYMNYICKERTGNYYAYKYRKIFKVNGEELMKLPAEYYSFWNKFQTIFTAIGPKLLESLPSPPKGVRISYPGNKQLLTRIDLMSDEGGYQILPHTDSPNKLAAFLIYISDHPSLKTEGTSIFVPKEKNFRSWGGRQNNLAGFHERFRAKYKTNSKLGFRKTDNSLHGKLPVSKTLPIRRDTIIVTLQYKENYVT